MGKQKQKLGWEGRGLSKSIFESCCLIVTVAARVEIRGP